MKRGEPCRDPYLSSGNLIQSIYSRKYATLQLEAPYWTALTKLERAKMLRARADEGDEATAVSLVSESALSARELGFGQLERAALDFGVAQ